MFTVPSQEVIQTVVAGQREVKGIHARGRGQLEVSMKFASKPDHLGRHRQSGQT